MQEKPVLLIDGANLYHTVKNREGLIDFKRVRNFVDPWAAYYFTGLKEGENSLVPMTEWLSYNGYRVFTKPIRDYGDRTKGGNMVPDIMATMLICSGWSDEFHLFSGDGDFVPFIRALQNKGCAVTVYSTKEMAANEMRQAADDFVDLNDIWDKIVKQERE